MTVKQLREALAQYNDWDIVKICISNIPDDEDEDGFIYTRPESGFCNPEVEGELMNDGRYCIAIKGDYDELY